LAETRVWAENGEGYDYDAVEKGALTYIIRGGGGGGPVDITLIA